MKLYKLHIEGFRRLKCVDVLFGDATFCIGKNNAGKSSVLYAIEKLLSGDKTIKEADCYSVTDPETNETKVAVQEVILEAEFRNVPLEIESLRGFRGRTFQYKVPEGSQETGICIFYRKTFSIGKDVRIEIKSKKRTLKSLFADCKTPNNYIEKGADASLFQELFSSTDKKLSTKEELLLETVDDLWDIDEQQEVWIENPGGIQGNVLSRLPKFLRIPAEASADELDGSKNGVLSKTLNELFSDVRSLSENYKQAQILLNNLAKELDPKDSASSFGQMMNELNKLLSGIFPDSQLHATADLSDPDKALVPTFSIKMSSNIKTPISHQGTGMVRSAVFGILRYRQKWLTQREDNAHRGLILGFEEPEIYLHPSAANQMRDTIYELSSQRSQIVVTTHSPYMIDLSRKPRQVLNRFRCNDSDETEAHAFNVTDEFLHLNDDDKSHVKMLLKIDDYIARSFFTKKVVIVEGDSEDIVIREALKRLPESTRLQIKADFEIIKARGKASIIGLVKYLKALGVHFFVIHDRDNGTPKAEQYNNPIRVAVGNDDALIVLEECLEDLLGYKSSSNEKPYKAYKNTLTWGDSWTDIPEKLQTVLAKSFSGYIEERESI